ncbi:alanine racemase [Kocuria sp. LUK]|uniref:alanine racemase n=1 Tax=Kocuria sp. LUK TaxID=2897828 RepID=UPI001E452636|nr:alanine racemase [Kocuria sp. LUK]MCD1143807.1 alanine racemase [Kocuria sp. LUK]
MTPVLGLSVLVLSGCGQDGGAAADAPPATASGSVALAPSHGGLSGGNLVLADTGGDTKDPVTARFGEAEVECTWDERSSRHACTAPAHQSPGTVEVSFSAGGAEVGEKTSYTYTTPGTQDVPLLRVDTETVRSNAEAIRADYPMGLQLGAVLKNGEPVGVFGKVIEEAADVDYVFVPKLEDAISLREAGVEAKIAVLYAAEVEDIPLLVHYDVEVPATDPAWVEAAEQVLATTGGTLRTHVWVDTGMGREGVVPEEALPLARAVEDAEHLELAGIATHFSTITAEDGAAIERNDTANTTVAQKNRFDEAVASIRDAGLGENALIHAGASDVLAEEIEPLYYDLLRVGGMFFASSPPETRLYSWTTELTQVKTLPEGWCIDYGCTEPTTAPQRVGIVNHIPSRENELTYTVGGKQVPVLLDHGTVVTLDLSEVPEAAAGDEVQIDFSAEAFHLLDATAPVPVTTTNG